MLSWKIGIYIFEYYWGSTGSKFRSCEVISMRHRLYLLSSIVLPLFVGSLACGELIKFISKNGSSMNPVLSILMSLVFLATGIINTWNLICKSEKDR